MKLITSQNEVPKLIRHELTVAGTAQELLSYNFRNTNYDLKS